MPEDRLMDLVAGRSVAAERRPTRHIDWVLIVIVLALVVVGMFLLYSATNQTLRADGFDPFERVKRQVIVVVARHGRCSWLVASFDYRFFKVYAGFFYAAAPARGAAADPGRRVARPARSSTSPGARLLQLSPAEFVKLSVIVMRPRCFRGADARADLRDVLRVVGVGALALLLLLANVEIGTRDRASR